MLTVLRLSYQVWHKITDDELVKLVGLPTGISTDDYKSITGKEYVDPMVKENVTGSDGDNGSKKDGAL